MNRINELNCVEILETIRDSFIPKNYRFILAEILVCYFYSHTQSATEIKNYTNVILENRNIEAISIGFVRKIIESN